MSGVHQKSNFSHLKAHDEQLERLGLLAERYFADAPNTCLLKLRQLAEAIAQSVASRVGLYTSSDERQQAQGCAPRTISAPNAIRNLNIHIFETVRGAHPALAELGDRCLISAALNPNLIQCEKRSY